MCKQVLFDLYPRAALHSARRLAVWSCFLHNAATGRSRGRRSRRRRTRTLHICKTEGTWKLMLMTGTAAARDCLDVAGRNFCFLVSWPQEGRLWRMDARGEERKEAYLPSEAELSRLRGACEHACNPLALNSRWGKLEIGPSNLSRPASPQSQVDTTLVSPRNRVRLGGVRLREAQMASACSS